MEMLNILQPVRAEVTWLAVLWMWRKMEQVGTLWWAMDWWIIEACSKMCKPHQSNSALQLWHTLTTWVKWAMSTAEFLPKLDSEPGQLFSVQPYQMATSERILWAWGGKREALLQFHMWLPDAARSAMRFCFCVFFEEYGPPVTRPWTAVGSYCVRRPQNSVLRTLGHWNFCVLRCEMMWVIDRDTTVSWTQDRFGSWQVRRGPSLTMSMKDMQVYARVCRLSSCKSPRSFTIRIQQSDEIRGRYQCCCFDGNMSWQRQQLGW
jgi:hypothetical protein